MSVEDFHYRVRWDQFEAAYLQFGGAVMVGGEPGFLEGVENSRATWEKVAMEIASYCEFIDDNPSVDQQRLCVFVRSFSDCIKREEPPQASYSAKHGNGLALAFSPSEVEAINKMAGSISVSEALLDYGAFEDSGFSVHNWQQSCMENYLTAILAFWKECPDGFGIVYTRF